MKKGIALIAMLLAAVMMMSGCNLIGYDAELDGNQVVAKVNDTEITKAEWLAYRDYLASYYQQYAMQYFGSAMQLTEDDIKAYGESALEQMIESTVLGDKIKELGFDPLPEEDQAGVEAEADQMLDLYKMMIRFQNYPDLETVEEEAERLKAEATAGEAAAEATAGEAVESEATAGEAANDTTPKATVTNAELDEMLLKDLEAIGYTREYLIDSKASEVQAQKVREYAVKDVVVTDEQIKAEFDAIAAQQKESYDESPNGYVAAEQRGTVNYYVPEGYRGVKNLLVKFSDEKQSEIDALNTEIRTAQNTLDDANKQLADLKAQDVSKYDEDALNSYNEQVASLEATVAEQEPAIAEKQTKLDEVMAAAYEEIQPIAEEALAKAQEGTNFDELIEAYGKDQGMNSEPNKTRGYLVREGLSVYEPSFQEAAMALANVGDVSGLVKTGYGYHILQYAGDIPAGVVEMTDEIKTTLHDQLLAQAQDAAFEAALTQWVSEATVETYPKVMK